MRLNLSKKGLGLSFGIKGFRVSSGPNGQQITVSIPGTGLSYTKRVSGSIFSAGRTSSQMPDLSFNALVGPAQVRLHCFNCHSLLSPEKDICDNCGRCTFQGYAKFGYSIGQFRLLILFIALTLLAVVLAAILFCSNWHKHELLKAARLEQERHVHLIEVISRLHAENPRKGYTIFPSTETPTSTNFVFHQAAVRTVTLSQSNDVVTASLGLMGVQKENQAPTIYVTFYVTLYDNQGNLLSRSPIAKFTFAVLEYGQTREIEDTMELPRGASPAIVSVDDGS